MAGWPPWIGLMLWPLNTLSPLLTGMMNPEIPSAAYMASLSRPSSRPADAAAPQVL